MLYYGLGYKKIFLENFLTRPKILAPYFARAILQSGSATAPWALENRQVALTRAVVLYEHMKCGNMSRNPENWDMDKVIRCLLDASAEKIR